MARSVTSVDGTEASLDGNNGIENRSQSPLGNFIMVEGVLPLQPANENYDGGGKQGRQDNSQGFNGRDDTEKGSSRSRELFDFLTGKTDVPGMSMSATGSTTTAANGSCAKSLTQSVKSPIKKRPRNKRKISGSRPKTK